MLTINGGTLRRVDQLGNIKATIANDAVDFDENDEYIAVVHRDGSVVLYADELGNIHSRVTNEARRVRLDGDEILVLKEDGRWIRYNDIGTYLGSY